MVYKITVMAHFLGSICLNVKQEISFLFSTKNGCQLAFYLYAFLQYGTFKRYRSERFSFRFTVDFSAYIQHHDNRRTFKRNISFSMTLYSSKAASYIDLSHIMTKPTKRPAMTQITWASALSEQSLGYPREEALDP